MTLEKFVVVLLAVLAVHGENATFSKNKLARLARKAGEYEFPFQVSIQVDESHICGGSLISTQHVLTAAHCVHLQFICPESRFVKGQRMIVEVGSNILGNGIKHKIRRISHISSYRGFLKGFLPDDIAVITLRTPVTLSAKVKLIKLPTAYSEIPNDWPVRVGGFGSIYRGGPVSRFLRTSPMLTVSQSECNDYYVRNFGSTISSSHLCANYTKDHGACGGDSGGPLIYNGDTVVGVVSGGHKVCGLGNPDVYTKVSHFMNYIEYEMTYNPFSSRDDIARALDIEKPPAGALPPWRNLSQYYILFLDPHTEEVLPPGSHQIVVYANGMVVPPYRQQKPIIALYPLYMDKVAYDLWLKSLKNQKTNERNNRVRETR